MSGKPKAKIGVIGTGGLARSQHLSNLILAGNTELAAICDLRQEVLDELQKRYPGVPAVTDYRELLAMPDIGGVIIATREDTHVPLTLEALRAGKHVYVEKPLAETREECLKVIAAEKQSGRRVMVGMNRRMAPAYREARNILRRHGGAFNMYYRIADAYSLDWGARFGSGKRLVHEVCHVFDILCFFAESRAESVYCIGSRADDESILIRFQSGATAMILSSGYAQWEMPKEHLEIIAQSGSLTVDEFTELRTYGLPGEVPLRRYAGHAHIDREQIHRHWFEADGLEGVIALRAALSEKKKHLQELEEKGLTDTAEYRHAKDYFNHKMPLINYSVDKGWLAAVEHFGNVILHDIPVEAATAADALAAAEMTAAALRSRESARPEPVNSPQLKPRSQA